MKFKTNFKSTKCLPVSRVMLLIFLILICGTLSAQINKSYFKVTYATAQTWHGGAQGSGSGVYYNFHIVYKKTASIGFDSVWIDHSYTSLFTKSMMLTQKYSLKKGDSIVLNAEIYHPGEKEPAYNDKEPVQIPSPLKNCKSPIIILFRVNGKLYYYDIKNVKGLKPVNYP